VIRLGSGTGGPPPLPPPPLVVEATPVVVTVPTVVVPSVPVVVTDPEVTVALLFPDDVTELLEADVTVPSEPVVAPTAAAPPEEVAVVPLTGPVALVPPALDPESFGELLAHATPYNPNPISETNTSALFISTPFSCQ
jgi:hypothetical protein